MSKRLENQKEKVSGLLKLVQENPDAEIYPIVATGVVDSDDFDLWLGKWGRSEIEYVYLADERIYYDSIDRDELIEKLMDDDDFCDGLTDDEAEKKAESVVDNYDWKKVILVYIEER